jgi:metal-dependent amidase/aminoacylase/carboxypeptidase family protein
MNIGETGIIAIYNGEKPGKTILFRCELDALPIHEINTFEHRSLTNGVSHKCGHDGHMAILWFSNRVTSAKQTGKVILLSNLLKKMVAVRKSVFRHKICCI